MSIQKKILAIAEKEGYGKKEISGQNRGPAVRKYLSAVNINFPAPWCAAFVVWVLKEALKESFSLAFISSGYCPDLHEFAVKNKILSKVPEPGDVFLVYDSISSYHTGFVLSVSGDYFKTIEGNSNTNGSSNGDGIYSNTRPICDSYRFIKWWKLLEEKEKTGNIYVDNKLLSELVIINGVSYAPVRELCNAAGYKVEWNAKEKSVYCSKKEDGN